MLAYAGCTHKWRSSSQNLPERSRAPRQHADRHLWDFLPCIRCQGMMLEPGAENQSRKLQLCSSPQGKIVAS